MTRKHVLFIANSLVNAYKFQHVLAKLDVEIAAGSTGQIKRLLAPGMSPDLVIFEAIASAQVFLDEIITLVESRNCPLLTIAESPGIEQLRLPSAVPCDFIASTAGELECLIRTQRLLGINEAGSHDEVIVIDSMTLNLATYQVTVADEPVDFTYLEYMLLAFLVQNPNHTFSRDTLLENVWGFDYYGGSRTVDVHVRRIRAKLGPNLAQHLETVRGVGYLWNSQ